MENMLVRPAYIKADTVDQVKGFATFIVSVFGNEDLGGDVVMPGAFKAAIATQTRMPKFAPNHDLSVEKKLGKVLAWRETPEGLEIDAQFNLEKQIAKDVLSDFIFDPGGQEFSFSYDVAPGGQKIEDGVRFLSKISEVMDVGPVGLGMNPRTHLIGVKGGSGPASDTSAWDKNQAMGACNSAADYRSICAGEHSVGNPDERQHWALPHHYLGKPANAAGVAAARARFGQTQDLTNATAARTHLFKTHSLPSDAGKSEDELVAEVKDGEVISAEAAALLIDVNIARVVDAVAAKAGRVISSKNETKLRQAMSLIDEVLGSLGDQAPSDTSNGSGKADDPSNWDKAEDFPVREALRGEWAALVAEEGAGSGRHVAQLPDEREAQGAGKGSGDPGQGH